MSALMGVSNYTTLWVGWPGESWGRVGWSVAVGRLCSWSDVAGHVRLGRSGGFSYKS